MLLLKYNSKMYVVLIKLCNFVPTLATSVENDKVLYNNIPPICICLNSLSSANL